MKAETNMVALQQTATPHQSTFTTQTYSGILSEKSAIAICGLGVALFTIPILVVIHVLSALYWGGTTVYQVLSGSGLDKTSNL